MDDVRNLAAVKVATDLLNEANGRVLEYRAIKDSVNGDSKASADALASLLVAKQQVEAKIAALNPAIQKVAARDEDIAALAEHLATLQEVAARIDEILDVHEGFAAVPAVNAKLAEIQTVAENVGDVSTVAASKSNIDTVAAMAGVIETLAGISADVTTVAGMQSELETVVGPNVMALGGLTLAANKGIHATGAGALATHDLTPFARTLLDDVNGPTMYGTLGQIPNAQVRNDLTPDKAFRRGNILGTVSQSGGTPTGAIIQQGSNANGYYVRFADGTQICSRINSISTPTAGGWGSGFISSVTSLTFPVAFVGTPVVSGANQYVPGDGYMSVALVFVQGVTSVSANFYTFSGVNSGGTRIGYIAIGRWY